MAARDTRKDAPWLPETSAEYPRPLPEYDYSFSSSRRRYPNLSAGEQSGPWGSIVKRDADECRVSGRQWDFIREW